MVGSASATKWLTDASYRVQAMGGATLGIEDETTALTVFNHENLAGLVLNAKQNRLDLGLVYNTDVVDTPNVGKSTTTDLELTRPGAEYRGLTYWVNDALVLRGGIEGMMISSVDKPASGGTDQKNNFSGMGGGVSAAYKLPFGLALGAGVVYTGAGGKPDPLPAGASKVEATANNLNWGVGAAYALEKLGADNNKLTLGAQVGTDDERPSMAGVAAGDFADFNGVIDQAAEITGFGTWTQKNTFTNSPMKISGEAIFDMGSLLSAGVLFDNKTRETKFKQEQVDPTGGFMGGSYTAEYKAMVSNIMGISPVVQANIPLAEGLNLLPGVMFTTYGSGTVDQYSPSGLTSSYKAATTTLNSTTVVGGLGLQALNKALQVAVQAGSGTMKSETKVFNAAGTQLGSATSPDTTLFNMGVGGEYKIIPMLAVRAGYTTTTTTLKATVEQKQTVNSISLGAGLSMMEKASLDLLVKLDTTTQDPAPDPKPTHTATGVYLGACIPL